MHALVSEPLKIALCRAEEILTLGIQENDPAMKLGAYRSLSDTTFFMDSFRRAKSYAESGVKLWRSGVSTAVVHDEVSAPIVTCICFDSLALSHLGDPSGALQRIEKAVEVANSLAHAHSLAVALHFEAYLGHFCGLPARTEATALRLVSLSQENGFHFWLAGAYVQLGWARTLQGGYRSNAPARTAGPADPPPRKSPPRRPRRSCCAGHRASHARAAAIEPRARVRSAPAPNDAPRRTPPIATTHGGSSAKNGISWLRVSLRATTISPLASTG